MRVTTHGLFVLVEEHVLKIDVELEPYKLCNTLFSAHEMCIVQGSYTNKS